MALCINWAVVQKLPEHHMTQKKALPINYVIGNQQSSRNKIHSITLELKHVINHYDLRRGMCIANLNAKEKRSFVNNS